MVIWCANTDAGQWSELGFSVVSKAMTEAQKLGKSLLTVMILWSSWALKSGKFAKNSKLHQLIEWCFENESILQVDGKRRDVISIFLQNFNLSHKSEKFVKILVKSCGDEFYSYLEQYVLHLESLEKKLKSEDNYEASEIVEINRSYPLLKERLAYFSQVLEKNELYRLVNVSQYSKMSVITALRSNKLSVKLKGLELLEASHSINNENVQNEILDILDLEDDPTVITKILEFDFFKKSFEAEKMTAVLLKKYVSVSRSEIHKKIRKLAKKSQNAQLSEMLNFYSGLKKGKFQLAKNLENIELVLNLIHLNSDILSQDMFSKALQAHFTENISDVENLKLHQVILKFIKTKNIPASFSESYCQSLTTGLQSYTQNKSLNVENYHKILSILSTYRQLFEATEDPQTLELAPISSKLLNDYLKHVFNLFLNFETSSDTEELESSIFQTVTSLLPKGKLKKGKHIPNISEEVLLLVLRALINSNFRNSYFLDLLRFVNHLNSLHPNAKESEMIDFTSKLVKEILKNRVEWEGGVFVEKWSDVRSSILDSSKFKSATELYQSVFQLTMDRGMYSEF